MKIKKDEVLKLIDDGYPLVRIFYPKLTDYQINKRPVNRKTAETLIHNGLVKLERMDFNGITKHYYTKKGTV